MEKLLCATDNNTGSAHIYSTDVVMENLTFPLFVSSENLISGYNDVSSIFNWHSFGKRTGRDYKFIRERIREFYSQTTWEQLTLEEKKICCQYFLVSSSEMNSLFNINEQIEMGKLFHENSQKSREKRLEKITAELMNRLLPSEYNEIIEDIFSTNMLYNKYLLFGREGILEGDPVGIFDYIESRSGTIYENNGFRNKPFNPIGFNNNLEFSVYLMDFIKYGKY